MCPYLCHKLIIKKNVGCLNVTVNNLRMTWKLKILVVRTETGIDDNKPSKTEEITHSPHEDMPILLQNPTQFLVV